MRAAEFLNAEGAEDAQRTQRGPVENDVSRDIIGAAMEVQRALGTGLMESAYSGALAIELAQRGLGFEREELHRAQLLSDLRVAGFKLGLLINFHAFPLVKGAHRLVNKL